MVNLLSILIKLSLFVIFVINIQLNKLTGMNYVNGVGGGLVLYAGFLFDSEVVSPNAFFYLDQNDNN
jgi:hypothetical protein